MTDTHTAPVLDARSVTVELLGRGKVLDGVSLYVNRGEVVGLVGESGCGKTVFVRAVLRLLPPAMRLSSGECVLNGRDVFQMSSREMTGVRGAQVAVVFQDPIGALDPVMTIGEQIAEAAVVHGRLTRRAALKAAVGLLAEVGMDHPETRAKQYVHQLSGGQAQRAAIAAALSADPDLLLADEPTTALDAQIRLEVLQLLLDLAHRRRMGLLLISHDLRLVGSTCERVYVMYAGRIVEEGKADEVLESPAHPYTAALLKALPVLGERRDRLEQIAGAVPVPGELPGGCAFAPRCDHADDTCRSARPEPVPLSDTHRTACFRVLCHG